MRPLVRCGVLSSIILSQILLNPSSAAEVEYSIGAPTAEEQLYLELINRARQDAPSEGARLRATSDPQVTSAYAFFNVDLDLLVNQFNVIPAAPPLSMNPQLTQAARLHSQFMLENNVQSHTGEGGSTPEKRIDAQGYPIKTLGENIFAYAESVWHGHAGFNVDWGNGPGGVQDPPGHRNSIHDPAFREIGIGVVLGSLGDVGPQLVTQDFATQLADAPFVTGVVYYDLNANQFYDLGEGIGGIRVEVAGAAYFGITAESGGYSVPVPGNGTYPITFSGSGLTAVSTSAQIERLENRKIDHVAAYVPPQILGPGVVPVQNSTTFQFTSVPGATGYQWRQSQTTNWGAPEGAENGSDQITAETTGAYAIITSELPGSGASSFHLAQPTGAPESLRLNQVLIPNADSQWTFLSRLGVATPDQTATAQVSVDNGASWQELWTQPGDGQGESAYSTKTIPLGAFAGREIVVRFVLEVRGQGTYFPDTDPAVGWLLDDISFTQTQILSNPVLNDVSAGNSFDFTPPAAGEFLLAVRPRVGGRLFPFGPTSTIVATAFAPSVRITQVSVLFDGRIVLEFTLEGGASKSFEVSSAPGITGPWERLPAPAIEVLIPNSHYRATLQPSSPARFFRVTAALP